MWDLQLLKNVFTSEAGNCSGMQLGFWTWRNKRLVKKHREAAEELNNLVLVLVTHTKTSVLKNWAN